MSHIFISASFYLKPEHQSLNHLYSTFLEGVRKGNDFGVGKVTTEAPKGND